MIQSNSREPAPSSGSPMRRALIDAARAAFAAQGYSAARIADISMAAGVSVGSFYTHFVGKHAALVAVLADLEAGLFETEDPAERDVPPAERLYRLNRRYLDAFSADAGLWYALERAALTDAKIAGALEDGRRRRVERVEALIRRLRADRAVAPSVEPGFTAVALTAMTEECAYLWFVYETAPDLDDAARGLADLWCRALRMGPSGRAASPAERPPGTTP